MVDILYTWLNTEISLSKKITNMERDFSNGYLFGELLYKCNQLVNFDEFIDSDQRYAKIHNFEILEKNFKNLDIPFDTIKAINVIEEKNGVSTKLIYQIKTAIERKGYVPDTIKVKKCNFK